MRRFGCDQIGFADDYRTGEVLLAFQHRGRRMQIMAIETGILSFEAVFMPYMITNDGRTIAERADQLGLLPGSAA